MMLHIYNNVKRVAAFAALAIMFALNMQAQEELHFFYHDGQEVSIEISDDMRVVFESSPYLNEISYTYHNADTIFLSCSGGSSPQSGLVESNVPWTIESDAEWMTALTYVPDSLREMYGLTLFNEYFYVYALPNTTDAQRVATLTLKTFDGKAKKQFTVVQQPYTVSFNNVAFENSLRYDGEPCLADTARLNWNDSILVLGVMPNHGVKISNNTNWMTLDTIAEPGANYSLEWQKNNPTKRISLNTSVLFKFDPNVSENQRTGEIVFEANGQKATCVVYQEGLNQQTALAETKELHKGLYQYYGYNHMDFGFPSFMLMMDARGMDHISINSDWNWFNAAQRYEDQSAYYIYTELYWRFFYNNIRDIILGINKYNEEGTQTYAPTYLSQAYALTAFYYFYLAQIYQQTYAGNEDAPCVPIITAENLSDEYTVGIPRSTVREVYEYILKNLQMSIDLLESNNIDYPSKGFISKEAAKALRARVYMVMNQWQLALHDANEVLDSGVATPYSLQEVSKPTFSNIADNAWLWGIDVDSDENINFTTGVINWPSHMGSFVSNSYTEVGVWRKISKQLFRAIPSSDVRKGWFLNEDCVSENLNQKYADYVSAMDMPQYTQVKFAPYNDEVGTDVKLTDIPMIRVEEMYLIAAEAEAMLNNTSRSKEILNTFVKQYRDPSYNCEAQDLEELLNAIWMQRRIEFWGEGISYFDLMRMKRPVDRRGAGFDAEHVFIVPHGDAARIYQLPYSNLTSNKQLIQNPEYTAPEPVEDYKDQPVLIGTGTYEYTVMQNGSTSNLRLYKDLTSPKTYYIENLYPGMNFYFTWDGKSEVTVKKQSTGLTHQSYGEISVMEVADYDQERFPNVHSYYNPETKTFYFATIYFVEAGAFSPNYEIFTLD